MTKEEYCKRMQEEEGMRLTKNLNGSIQVWSQLIMEPIFKRGPCLAAMSF